MQAVAALAVLLAQAPAEGLLPRILSRISEEAEVFARLARDVIGEETLHHKARKPPRRFRIGRDAIDPQPRYVTRKIVSEYGFASLRDLPHSLHEFRQVVSVNGKSVTAVEKARATLTMGVTSEDDNRKKQMLRDFARHGLVSTAQDLGPVVLLFSRRRLPEYAFSLAGEGQIGADAALIVSYRQTEGAGGLTIFEGRKAIHQPLEGQIWVRKSDLLPLRITFHAARSEGEADRVISIVHHATVDYAPTAYGGIMPVAVRHIYSLNGEPFVENLFEYSTFRRFKVDAEIKFTVEPEAGQP